MQTKAFWDVASMGLSSLLAFVGCYYPATTLSEKGQDFLSFLVIVLVAITAMVIGMFIENRISVFFKKRQDADYERDTTE